MGMKLGLPKGKSLEKSTLEILSAAHVSTKRSHERRVSGKIIGLSGFDQALFLKPILLPLVVEKKKLDAALTGEDTFIESGADVIVCKEFDYSRATSGGTRCVVFERLGTESRGIREIFGGAQAPTIVSEYPRETKKFFDELGMAVQIVPCAGDAEALVVAGMFDFGVALTETGTSLKQNDLREIETIFTSKTVLIANRDVYEDPDKRQRIDYLGKLIAGVLDARLKRYITMNVAADKMQAVLKMIPAQKSPTVQRLDDGGFAVSSVVPIERLAELKFELIQAGATDIVEFDHSSIVTG